jgi:hypothetical protein
MVNRPPAYHGPTGLWLRPSAARRKLSIAVLVTLFLAIGIPTSATQAVRPLAKLHVVHKLEAKPQGSLILCAGEQLSI